jgi:hypothetical protein
MAKHLASLAGKSASTVARSLLDAGDDAEAVAARYGLEPERRAFSHDEEAVRFLQERLNSGPCRADVLDDEVEAERLCEGSVEKAKTELNPVGRRITAARAPSRICAQKPRLGRWSSRRRRPRSATQAQCKPPQGEE